MKLYSVCRARNKEVPYFDFRNFISSEIDGAPVAHVQGKGCTADKIKIIRK